MMKAWGFVLLVASISVLAVVSVVAGILVFAPLFAEGAEKKVPLYEGESEWTIREVRNACDMKRVSKFDEKWECCAFIMQRLVDIGAFKVFNEMRWNFYEGWYAVILDVHVDYFLLVDGNSAFVFNGTCDGDTVTINSKKILFALGWGYTDPLSAALNQRTALDNTKQSIQVKWFKKPGKKGTKVFEFLYLNKERAQGIDKYYIVGYAYFGDVPDIENINWSSFGISSYRR